ncbi:hypothetical protein [Halodesulfovibrio marinisediminis]|uniref:Uncharacterized protein n=1 Tax=Halodesulfovibrio marinisediminis DSM 17456 TaxID=1121457 RepID=A0A1N6HZK3_9BACT|nr:hypothetical protein [Halodesulfovibrio marinisediminis]SIO25206.1 hypothetical protein SAMN02745161_2303 [Halodesulfovibrio marinisediminis DSM 17456]
MSRLEPASNLFDLLHHFWENPKTERFVAQLLIVIFLLGLLGIELNRQGLLPEHLAAMTPVNHFYAVNLAFSMLLVLEVLSLIFVLSSSVSKSLGKQLEIMTLILLRNSFKEFSLMHEPISVTLDSEALLHVAASGLAALAIFIILGMYYRVQRYQGYLRDPIERMRYVMTKKIIALVLFIAFITIGAYDALDFLVYGRRHDFFITLYTVLIFADILLVLVTQRFMPSFHAVFRNSGYVIATLFMRIALAAPAYYAAGIGVAAALFALAVAYATSVFCHGSLSTVNLSSRKKSERKSCSDN